MLSSCKDQHFQLHTYILLSCMCYILLLLMLSVYNKLFCFAFIKQVKCILKYYSNTGNLLDVEGKKWCDLVPKSFKHSYRCSKWIWIAHMLNELPTTLSCLGVGWKMRRLRKATGSDAEMEWGGYTGDGSAHMHIYHWWQTRASVKNAYLWLWIPTELISFTDLNALKMSKQINKSHKNQISVTDWMPF